MNKEEFSDILRKSDFTGIDMSDIRELIEKYPYFSTARILLLLAKKETKEPLTKEIHNQALCLHNRYYLHKLLDSVTFPLHRAGISDQLVFKKPDRETEKTEVNYRSVEDKTESEIHENKTIEKSQTTEPVQGEEKNKDLLDFTYTEEEIPDTDIKEQDSSSDSTSEEKETKKSAEKHEDFVSWINEIQNDQDEEEKADQAYKKTDLIEEFINGGHGPIRADKETNIKGDISSNSIEESEDLITDTLAKIYVKQGLYSKAIYAYEKLSLKYPEKSAYFASQIEQIKKLK